MPFNSNPHLLRQLHLKRAGKLQRRFILPALLSLAMLTTALGQNTSDARFVSCTQTDQRIEFTVEAKLTPAGGSAPESLNWVIKRIPAPESVVVNCPFLKRRILEELAEQKAPDGSIPIAIDGVPINQFLMDEITGIEDLTIIPPGGLETAPQAADMGREFKAVMCITFQGACPSDSKPVATIRITTKAGALAPLAGVPGFTLAGADGQFSNSPAGQIPAQLVYAADDLLAAKKDPAIVTDDQAHGRVKSELFLVAVAAFEKARLANGLDQHGVPTFGLNDPASGTVFT